MRCRIGRVQGMGAATIPTFLLVVTETYSLYYVSMHREPDSHKGENGKVAVVGGSLHMHGAPIFAALAAEASGADLVYLMLPKCHTEAATRASLNLQVHTFAGDDLTKSDVVPALELLATMDSAVLGPGIDRAQDESVAALKELITGAGCSLVLDATALQPETLELVKGKTAVLTPHLGELERMKIKPKELAERAEEAGVVILLKDQTDRIAGPDGKTEEVSGGNAGLTVGGTGDALAGLIAGLIAQGVAPFDASVGAARVMKRAAETLEPEKGVAYTARDVIGLIPQLLKNQDL